MNDFSKIAYFSVVDSLRFRVISVSFPLGSVF